MTTSAATVPTASAPRSPRPIGVAVGLGALLLAIVFAVYFVFSRSMSLDEGYLMITVQGFDSGHPLYDSVFTQYGPFYYFYEWLLHAGLQVPLTHDATRLVCVVHWLGAALLLGLAAWRLTRSALASIFVALLAVAHLSTIADEPGHSQELVVLLLALAAVVAARPADESGCGRCSLRLLAIITALLFCTKVNVGVFFGFALLLALRCHSTDRLSGKLWNWALLTLAATLPFVLMRQHLSLEWCRNFGLVTACATVATLWIAQRASTPRTLTPRIYLAMGVVFAVTTGLLLGFTLLTGTSSAGLIDGLLTTPLKMPRVALLPIVLPPAALLGAIASVAVAVFVTHKQKDAGRSALIAQLVATLKIVFSCAGAFWLFDDAKNQMAWLLPWVWLVAVPSPGEEKPIQFARVFLALAAAWQSLQAYPIAGTQVTLATFLLVLAYGVCLRDALAVFAKTSSIGSRLAALAPSSRALATTLAGVAVLFLFTNYWSHLPQVRNDYARLRPLNLPGSRLVRMDDETVEMYQALSRYLATESDTFVAYPGINSLYFWTGQRPPTQINSTGWGQLTHAQQNEILGSLHKGQHPKLVIVEAMMQGWDTPYADPIRPLVRFAAEECRPVQRIGRFLIFEPKAPAGMAAAH